MLVPNRHGSSESYRYGFNTQEKVDEISGEGNHNTAKFWEYDTRTGRRWNLDPVKKSWQSDYLVFSGNPIWKIDPDGDDDYFNADGTFSHRTKQGSKIIVQTKDGNRLLTEISLTSKSNRQVIANVVGYYADQVGITFKRKGEKNSGEKGIVGLKSARKKTSAENPAFTSGDDIYVNKKNGTINDKLYDFNNLKSVLEHEKDHKDKGHGYDRGQSSTENFEHAKVYLTQMQSETFNSTTADFKKGMAGSVAKYLKDAAYDEIKLGNGDFTALDNLVGEFNKLSKSTGYTFNLVTTNNGFSNVDAYEYEVYVTPTTPKK